MNYPKHKNLMKAIFQVTAFTLLALVCLAGMPADTSAQVGSSLPETIPVGSLIIPMDNEHQGNADGCSGVPAFNLKAYGLAVRLLHNNVPIKWAIANKATKDAVDFTATVSKVAGPTGTGCDSEVATSRDFSGGPLVISSGYSTQALSIISTFNSEITGSSNDVSVYQVVTSAVSNVPVRYTLTHKPLVAVGPVSGGWGGTPHEVLFTEAKLTGYYSPVADIDIGPGSCYTMATQAHATAAPYYNQFRSFVQSGGNFLIQCESITHYEQDPIPHYLSTNGFTLFGNSSQFPSRPNGTPNNSSFAFDNPSMPFNQFIGGFAGDIDGAVSEYSVNAPGFMNNVNNGSNGLSSSWGAVRNTNSGWNTTYIAAVGRIATSTNGGGHVFTMGGHDYYRGLGDPANASLERRNAQRMILNAILIPSVRNGCGLDVPVVSGFKQVQTNFAPGDDVAPIGFINPNDVATWTIRYINTSPVPISNFQIVDTLQTGLQFLGPLVVTATGGSTTASANGAYTGVAGPGSDMLAGGAYLDVGGKIEVRVRTRLTAYTTYLNHPTAYGTGLPSSGVQTDTVDITSTGTVGGYPRNSCNTPANAPCFPQDDWQTANLDPTGILLVGPSAAPVYVEGRVIGGNGRGIQRTTITLRNAVSGEERVVTTNTFGYFRFDDLTVGDLYIMSPFNKQYAFPSGDMTFTLDDNLDGVTFVGVPKVRGESAPETRVTPAEPKANVTRVVIANGSATKNAGSKRR